MDSSHGDIAFHKKNDVLSIMYDETKTDDSGSGHAAYFSARFRRKNTARGQLNQAFSPNNVARTCDRHHGKELTSI